MRRRSDPGLGFTDLLFNALLGFVVMFILAFLLITPIAKSGAVDPKAEFLVTLAWPDGFADDVDLYLEDPRGNLVWFRQREAGLMHLDRDDLGRAGDVIEIGGERVVNPLNQEIISIRGILPGEYVANVHLYRHASDRPVPVSVKVEKLNPSLEVVFYQRLELGERAEEQTAVRFTVDASGRVGALSRLAKPLVPLRRASGRAAPSERTP